MNNIQYVLNQKNNDIDHVAEWEVLMTYENADGVRLTSRIIPGYAKGYYQALNLLRTFEDHALLIEKVTMLEQAIDEALQRQESDAELLIEFITQAREMRDTLAQYEATLPRVEPAVAIDWDDLFNAADHTETPLGLFEAFINGAST